jgi:hypothetical protein
MVSLQPFYIQGIHVKQAKESAFGAAGVFIVTFVASICWLYAERTRRIPDIVHAVDGEHDVYDEDHEEEHPSLHHAAAEYDGDSEYVQRAMLMSRSAVQQYRQQRQQRQQQQQQQPIASTSMSLEMRSRPSSSTTFTTSGELL